MFGLNGFLECAPVRAVRGRTADPLGARDCAEGEGEVAMKTNREEWTRIFDEQRSRLNLREDTCDPNLGTLMVLIEMVACRLLQLEERIDALEYDNERRDDYEREQREYD